MPAINEIEVLHFFASLVRVSALFMLIPIFGDNTIPMIVRVFLAFTVNLIVYPIAAASSHGHVANLSVNEWGMLTIVFKELLVGVILGFTARVFFDGLSFAFGHMGTQMGFNMATTFDHQSEASVPVISQMIMILATLLFLAVDGHHLFIKALVQSYDAVPLGSFILTKQVVAFVLDATEQVFWIAIKLSAPMAMVIFMINCAFGIIAKAVPQINVLVVSFTVNILAGFLVISLTLPVFGTNVNEVFRLMAERMAALMALMA